MPDSGILTGTVSKAAFEQVFGQCTADGLPATAVDPEWHMDRSSLDEGWVLIEVKAVGVGGPAEVLNLVARPNGDTVDVRIVFDGTDYASCDSLAGRMSGYAALFAGAGES